MFTGLVEGLVKVRSVVPEGTARRVCVEPLAQAGDVVLGESIALNGCCLTLVSTAEGGWWFQAGAETLARTNLGDLGPGDVVNVERALPANARLGGHFVQGHIDGVGQVERIDVDGEWRTFWFQAPPALCRGMVSKGSIAVDGVSLTLVAVEAGRFSVMLIPHTLQVTTLGVRRVGSRVNLETDILGKYVQRLLETGRVDAGPLGPPGPLGSKPDA